MAHGLAKTLRILRPAPNVMAFYDGRRPGNPLFAGGPNWQTLGYDLGTCSYAIVAGGEALVYDTHISRDHAVAIRAAVEAEGADRIRVVLSHHHTDHIAGNEVFSDCPILANVATANAMEEMREALAIGTPPLTPLVMPTDTFDTDMTLDIGGISVALRSYDIHSHDGLVLWLPETQTLFAGDTLEDPVTFVCEPDGLETHLRNLSRLAELPVTRILPNHGDPEIIARGGFGPDLINATRRYVERLLDCASDPGLATADLRGFLADDLASGILRYYPDYEIVHRQNVQAVLDRAEHSITL